MLGPVNLVLTTLCLSLMAVSACTSGGTSSPSATGTSSKSTASAIRTVVESSAFGDTYVAGLPGTSDHQCSDVDSARERGDWATLVAGDQTAVTVSDGAPVRVLDVRSGDLFAGNFYEPHGEGQPGEPDFRMKTYFVAVDERSEPGPLTITVTGLDGATPDQVVTVSAPSALHSESGAALSWPSGLPIPGRGRWRLTATGDGLWACFDLTI